MRARRLRVSQVLRPRATLPEAVAAVVRERPEEVVEALAPLLLDERRKRIEEVLAVRTRAVLVVLDRVGDPHNSAAVIRTAEGFGLQEVHAIYPRRDLPLSRRVTQGCHKWLDVVSHREPGPCLEALARRGYALVAASERSAVSPRSLAGLERVALCMGNEHEGLSPPVREACVAEVGIAMVGFTGSLNVSVATAVLLEGLLEGRRRGLDPEEIPELRARYYALSVRNVLDVLERQGLR